MIASLWVNKYEESSPSNTMSNLRIPKELRILIGSNLQNLACGHSSAEMAWMRMLIAPTCVFLLCKTYLLPEKCQNSLLVRRNELSMICTRISAESQKKTGTCLNAMVIAPPVVQICKTSTPTVDMSRFWVGMELQIIIGSNVHLLSSDLAYGTHAWTLMVTEPIRVINKTRGEEITWNEALTVGCMPHTPMWLSEETYIFHQSSPPPCTFHGIQLESIRLLLLSTENPLVSPGPMQRKAMPSPKKIRQMKQLLSCVCQTNPFACQRITESPFCHIECLEGQIAVHEFRQLNYLVAGPNFEGLKRCFCNLATPVIAHSTGHTMTALHWHRSWWHIQWCRLVKINSSGHHANL